MMSTSATTRRLLDASVLETATSTVRRSVAGPAVVPTTRSVSEMPIRAPGTSCATPRPALSSDGRTATARARRRPALPRSLGLGRRRPGRAPCHRRPAPCWAGCRCPRAWRRPGHAAWPSRRACSAACAGGRRSAPTAPPMRTSATRAVAATVSRAWMPSCLRFGGSGDVAGVSHRRPPTGSQRRARSRAPAGRRVRRPCVADSRRRPPRRWRRRCSGCPTRC